MSAFVYVLKSVAGDRVYVGVTKDINERLVRHNQGRVRVTAKHAPYKILYSESFPDLVAARRRELFFKSGDGRRALKIKLQESE